MERNVYIPTRLIDQYALIGRTHSYYVEPMLGQSYQSEILSPLTSNLAALNPGKNLTIADLGSGIGELQRFCAQFFSQATIVSCDISQTGLRFAADKRLIMRAEKLPFAADSLDGIHCKDVLVHVQNKSEMLEEAFRALKPGGILTIVSESRNRNLLLYKEHGDNKSSYFKNIRWYIRRASSLIRKGAIVDPPYFRTKKQTLLTEATRIGFEQSVLLPESWIPDREEKDWYLGAERFILSLVKPRL